jgi:glycosyltransferase involved in cell wall biosynthesis
VVKKPIVKVIIPAFNEEESIGLVVSDIPRDIVSEVVVVNNGSTDKTDKQAIEAGATVLKETERGYGAACLKGINYLKESGNEPDILVFMDGDYSDYPGEIKDLLKPIVENDVDIVIGSRVLGNLEKGAMTPQQVFGNSLATRLMKLFFGVKYTDLGPFRAIKFSKLIELNMVDRNFGWTVEMQVKAAKLKYSYDEVPVNYRKRIGFSKVSGTVKGSILAGYKILFTIFKSI